MCFCQLILYVHTDALQDGEVIGQHSQKRCPAEKGDPSFWNKKRDGNGFHCDDKDKDCNVCVDS